MDYRSIVRDTYNKVAKKYSETRGAFQNDKELAELVSLVRRDGTVLDLGCGSGIPVDRYLVDAGLDVIGIDISNAQLELARVNVPQATFVLHDIAELKMGEYSVDAVVSFYAIFHVPRELQPKLFKNINSFLPVGGPLLVTMATTDWEGVDEDFFGEQMYESHYAPEQNRKMIESAGFTIIRDDIDARNNERHQIILAKKE